MPAPLSFDRRHAVSAEQEAAWQQLGKPTCGMGKFGADTPGYWVSQTSVQYAPILDHGFREETHGIVIHVNDGWYHGTLGFFTNGLAEPWGSEGVGAHFEMGGQHNNLRGEYADGPPVQLLPLDAIAWHAVEANNFSIGVEHAGFGYSTWEWETEHYNIIGNSAYRIAWMLRRYNLGPPSISTNPNHGNIWPHSAGGASWGGHICPGSTQNNVDYFPWQLFHEYCLKAYNQKWGF